MRKTPPNRETSSGAASAVVLHVKHFISSYLPTSPLPLKITLVSLAIRTDGQIHRYAAVAPAIFYCCERPGRLWVSLVRAGQCNRLGWALQQVPSLPFIGSTRLPFRLGCHLVLRLASKLDSESGLAK